MKTIKCFVASLTLALVMTGIVVSPAGATPITFSGTSGILSASVEFDLSSSNLLVTLTNTSLNDVLNPTDVLTGVFFNTNPIHTLTPVSASLNGSTVYYGTVAGSVGAGWQYLSGINAQGDNSGISATGLGIFGPDGNFFSPPVAEDGLAYGILSAGDNAATGNGGVKGHGPLIKNSVQFLLTAGQGFSLSDLNSIVFQYGTALDEPYFPCNSSNCTRVPEPSTLLLLGGGLVGLCGIQRWRAGR